jgi:hypothetical protein
MFDEQQLDKKHQRRVIGWSEHTMRPHPFNLFHAEN